MVVRERYIRQLDSVREDLLRLGNMVEHALQRAIRSLETWNTTLAAQVIQDDTEIDEARRNVEETVITLIATQQPVASDLRLLGSVFAIATELERIGDYASSIAKRLQRVTKRPRIVTAPPGINEMTSLVQKMLGICLDAFLKQSTDLAHSLIALDNRVDELEDTLRDELIAMAHEDSARIEAVLDLLDVVHALERAADRTTNIGERVIYLVTNEMEELNP